jgi:integrase
MHNDFTVFKRRVPSGKKVVYYYAYDENGVRKGPWTTNCETITEARNFINGLIKNGVLIPDRRKVLTFGEFAEGFWDLNSEFVRYQRSRKDVGNRYLILSKRLTVTQITPFFGKLPLDAVTDADVDKWLLGFPEREVIDEKTGKIKEHYKNSYANAAYRTLKIMFTEAARRGLIKTSPCNNVKPLKNNKKQIEILTVEEVRKLFPQDYAAVWGDKEVAHAVNLLAAVTGMRIGEVLGLRGEYVFDDYITVCGQYGVDGYKPYTKTKTDRSIPVMPAVLLVLHKLMKSNGQGFIFSLNGGATPVSRNYIARELNKAFDKVGISREEIKQRGLTLHSWRPFLNTELQRQGLTVSQVQSVTGHKSQRMTEWYNHPDARNIPDVTKAQGAIFGGNEQKTNPDGGVRFPALTLVKQQEQFQPELKGA